MLSRTHLPLRRLTLALIVTTALLTTGTPSSSAAHAPSFRAHAVPAKKLLAHSMRGRAALKVLDAQGKRDAAAENGMSVARLTADAQNDDTVWLGPTGRIFFADTAQANEVQSAAVTASAPGWAVHPNSEAFLLHSKPGSKHTIYLDFDGYTLPSGTGWDGNPPAIPAATYGGFTDDGSASFTDAELTYVQTVWRIVSEKYAPFDIDVTTEQPPAGALDYTGGGDQTWGTRVVITSDMAARGSVCTAGPSSGCIGIAYINVFNALEPSAGYYEPAWVYTKFTADTATLSAGTTANAAAHEAGHTLGLDHDTTQGMPDGSYYGGSGNWFPIMGSGHLAVGQFSKGDYPNARTASGQSNVDDLAVIASDGAPARVDDYADTTGSASTLALGGSVDGIIGTRTDLDVFKVVTGCQGDLTASAQGIGDGQAVDLKVSILNDVGGVLTSDDQTSDQDTNSPWPFTPTGMDASATQSAAAAGTYYVSIDGVGKGTFATGGYDDYGSIGQYHLTVTGCGSGGSAPGQPVSVTATPAVHATTGTVSWTAPSDNGGSAITGYTITGLPDGPHAVSASTFNYPATGLAPGVTYDVAVAASNQFGTGTAKHANLRVATWAPSAAPGITVTPHSTSVDVTWTAPANPGGATPTGWHVTLFNASHVALIGSPEPTGAIGTTISGMSPGTYSVEVYQDVSSDNGSTSATASKVFALASTVPTKPQIRTASSGTAGGAVNAVARWAAPISNGGSAITGYRVIAYKSTISGSVISATVSKLLAPSARSYTFALPAGRYKFRVVAYNAVGRSPYSAYSALVYSR